jgi:NADPH:quinone reductase-like Zn-dependent oxidoreductase
MKAIVQRKYGAADEVLRLEEVEVPTVKDDEALVRVYAASVHPDVWHVVTGLPYVVRTMGAGLRRPKHPIPGTDLAGRVEKVGRLVTELKPGDDVFGEIVRGHQWHNGGAYAEYAAVPATALERKPKNLTFEEAAAIPTTGLIALFCLRTQGELRAGQTVLINGAGGGVGTFAVQIAKAFGAEVTAVDHASKLEMLRSIGADRAVDYEKEDVTRGAVVYDLVLDVASNLALSDCRRILTEDGIYVRVGHEHYDVREHPWVGALGGFFALVARSPFDRHLPTLHFRVDRERDLRTLRDLAETGKLTPVIDRTFPLAEVPEAIRYMTEERARGRIVITAGSPSN